MTRVKTPFDPSPPSPGGDEVWRGVGTLLRQGGAGSCEKNLFFFGTYQENPYLCTAKGRKAMNTIEINNTGIKVDVSVFLFKEDDVFHAYCPELDLIGYDSTEEGAKKSFEYVLKDYLDYTVENGTLEQDLLNHGWSQDCCAQ